MYRLIDLTDPGACAYCGSEGALKGVRVIDGRFEDLFAPVQGREGPIGFCDEHAVSALDWFERVQPTTRF